MDRKEVLDIFIENLINSFSGEQRKEELYDVWISNWSGVEGWSMIPEGIRKSIEKEIRPEDYQNKKYDSVLFLKFRDRFKGYRNEYLSIKTGLPIDSGSPIRLSSCPCCGFRTIEERNDFDICTVCWWEDDGQDNEISDTILGGPNYGISLIEARINFIQYGIYDPERKDLMEIKDEPLKFEQGRFFEIRKNFLIETGTEWKTRITDF